MFLSFFYIFICMPIFQLDFNIPLISFCLKDMQKYITFHFSTYVWNKNWSKKVMEYNLGNYIVVI